MTIEEQEVIDYLRALPNQFLSAREICRKAGGKKRFRKDPDWAKPILKRLANEGILEADANGHYRLKAEQRQKPRAQIQLSPQIAAILAKSGKKFDDVVDLEQWLASSEAQPSESEENEPSKPPSKDNDK